MKTSEAIEHYGTQTAVAAALGIDQSSVSEWKEYPPDRRQVQLEMLTGGKLKAEAGCMDRLIGLKRKDSPKNTVGA